jgi:hypothetical protein
MSSCSNSSLASIDKNGTPGGSPAISRQTAKEDAEFDDGIANNTVSTAAAAHKERRKQRRRERRQAARAARHVQEPGRDASRAEPRKLGFSVQGRSDGLTRQCQGVKCRYDRDTIARSPKVRVTLPKRTQTGPAASFKEHTLSGILANVRGYTQARPDLLSTLSTKTNLPMLVLLTETWLTANDPNKLISLAGYEMFRRDRVGRVGGGLLLFVRSDVKCSRRPELEHAAHEYIALDVICEESTLTVFGIYRPPDHGLDIFDVIEDHVSDIPNNVVVLGDLNASSTNFGSPVDTSAGKRLFEFCNLCGIEWIPSEPTRPPNCLDVVFSDLHGSTRVHAPFGSSDHMTVFFDISIVPKVSAFQEREIYLWERADWPRIRNEFSKFHLDHNLDANEAAAQVTKLITEAQRRFVPTRLMKTPRPMKEPWWTARCSRSKKKFDDAHISGNLQQLLHAKAIHRKNCFSAKQKYSQKLKSEMTENRSSRWWWRTASKVGGMGKSIQQTRQMPPVNALLDHFSNKLTMPPAIDNKDVPTLQPVDGKTKLSRFRITTQEVFRVLKKLDINKSVGDDNISPRLLKNCALSLSGVISSLFRIICRTATFPAKWKIGRITPLFKNKGSPLESRFWRPVTVVSQLALCFEKVTIAQLAAVLTPHVPKEQFGFVKNSSPSDMLALLENICSNALEARQEVKIVGLDLEGAFDSLWFKGLLAQLSHLGISGQVFQLMSSYFTDRKICVVANGERSETRPINRGAPQGAVWSPLLFAVYVRLLPRIPQSSKLLMFADDASVYAIVPTKQDRKRCIEDLAADIEKLSQAGREWNLSFAPDKSQALTMSNKNDAIDDSDLKVVTADGPIPETTEFKILGVTFDTKNHFSSHIKHLASEASKGIFLLRKLKPYMDERGLSVIYKAYIRSRLEYGCVAWMGGDYLSLLDRVQSRCAKFFPTQALSSLSARRNAAAAGFFLKITSREGRQSLQQVKINWRTPPTRSSRHYEPFQLEHRLKGKCLKASKNGFTGSFPAVWNKLPRQERRSALLDARNGCRHAATKRVQRLIVKI